MDITENLNNKGSVSDDNILCNGASSSQDGLETNLIKREISNDLFYLNQSLENNLNSNVQDDCASHSSTTNSHYCQLKREFADEKENTRGEYPSKFMKLNCDTEDMLRTTENNTCISSNNEENSITKNWNGEAETLRVESEKSESFDMDMDKTSKLENQIPSDSANGNISMEEHIDEYVRNENCVSKAENSEHRFNGNNIDENVATETVQIIVNENETSTTSCSSSSDTSSSSEFDEISENRIENDINMSDDENNESDSQSSSTESSSTTSFSEEEYDEIDMMSLDIDLHAPFTGDSGSGSDDQEPGSSEKKLPEVLGKTLPAEKFSFPREIFNRQFKGDNVKRKRSLRFEDKIYSSRRMVQRLKLYRSLQKHSGCVNCVSFNDSGNILISASDDRHVCLWDWSRNKSLLFYDSGHVANVFQAKFLPNSGDTKLITCGLDHQIRMSSLDSCGVKNTRLIVKHTKTVHKIALQRQMPHSFLSAGEDGVVYSIDIRDSKSYCTKLLGMYGKRSSSPMCLYSINCNPVKNYEFIVCGNSKEVRLYDQRKISPYNFYPVKTFCPVRLLADDSILLRSLSGCVTCSVFNYNGTEVLASYNDNNIYLFDSTTGKEVHHYDGHRNFQTIKGVNFYGPRSEYVVSGSDCGYIYMWDKNYEAIVQWLKGDKNTVNFLEPHPSLPVLATSGLESDVKVWMPIQLNDEDCKTNENEVRSLGEDQVINLTLSKEFQRVTKKNSRYQFDSYSQYPRRSFFFRSVFDPQNIEHEYASSELPVILRYSRALNSVGSNFERASVWNSPEELNDPDDERSCDSVE